MTDMRRLIGDHIELKRRPYLFWRYWFMNRDYHRDDGGPAIEWRDGNRYWYEYGTCKEGRCKSSP